MKEKYIEERFQNYSIFGKNLVANEVGLAMANDPDVATVTRKEAMKLIENRDDTIDMIKELVQALHKIDPVKLREIWYK